MSVALLSAQELGLSVAIQIKLELCESSGLGDLCVIAEGLSQGNVKAFEHTYNQIEEHVSADEVEREALAYLADKSGRMGKEHFGPLVYNCIANNGTTFFAGIEVPQEDKKLALLRAVEKRCNKWQEGEQRQLQRQSENDRAYRDVGPLPMQTGDEVKALCESLGYQRVIIAEYRCNESDTYQDYWGHRTARQVVIGFGKGKRESFKQLRAAADSFEPTQHLGTGKGIYCAYSVWSHDHTDKAACEASMYQVTHLQFWKGHRSHFSDSPEFNTREELDAWLEANPLGKGNHYDICESNIEHRETYSMGGGNYLGFDRHSGWTVFSHELNYFSADKIEVLDIEFKPAKTSKPAKRKEVEVELLERKVEDNYYWYHLQHGKTQAAFYVSKKRDYISVSTGRSRVGKGFYDWEVARNRYRSRAMVALIDHAEKLASGETTEATEPVDTSDIDAMGWL